MSERNYSLQGTTEERHLELPTFDYQPPRPKTWEPRIGMIGCGGITAQHLTAYQKENYNVVAFCDLDEAAARRRRDEYYPEAGVYTDPAELLRRDDIDVVDIPLHVKPRGAVIEAALEAGKHVLSQKPFVLDPAEGHRLADLADRRGRKLAVNLNGRWAPYVRWITLAIEHGLIGETQSIDLQINWDHTWVKGSPFEKMEDLILYDFAVHWIDMTRLFFGGKQASAVFASAVDAPHSELAIPMMAAAQFRFDKGLASLTFDGQSRFLSGEGWVIAGSKGTLRSRGPVCGSDGIEIETTDGKSRLQVEGSWFPDGFRGSMGELLCAIEEDRTPLNDGRDNLASLALVFGALKSVRENRMIELEP